jgi:hypothetical protein
VSAVGTLSSGPGRVTFPLLAPFDAREEIDLSPSQYQEDIALCCGASHIVGDLVRSLVAACLRGGIARAADLHLGLAPLGRLLRQGGQANPVPLRKAAARLQTGMAAGPPRESFPGLSPDEVARLDGLMRAPGELPSPAGDPG